MKKQKIDPNIVAYLKDVEDGRFKDTKPGTWVAYHDGKFVLSHPSKEEFFSKLRKVQTGCFVTQVNITEEPIDLTTIIEVVKVRSPRLVENIKRKKKPKRA
ncbi:hypothetical protein A2572_02205 [Candidatus Collierbacteria bacterium RIFOXYD1_FULL_40_9]|uniref:DUF5678 domain-containing protein n=1 Tax=Candidatus Collierbacteria bacterium RIFOXYD1_FULL_40_9 TaxID=1817731 RepID=A0A1F5FTQ5_9BACT|nr:MAG: hypothetical protein A2572_02205 [Candidatus Collierbacteria bacterium RIFOXYD1_FULL_40_9]